LTITFSRTGGLVAAPGLRVRGVAVLTDEGGTVSAGAYARAISTEEAAALAAAAREAIDECRRHLVQPAPAPDAFRYSFTIAGDRDETAFGTSDAGPSPPAVARLVAWARTEADAIVASRA